jgi:DNA polymerase III subunit epsilon
VKKESLIYYTRFKFNVTKILNKENQYNVGRNIYKHPSHKWNNWVVNRQPISFLKNSNWSNTNGIGTVLGYNNLRALDIDGCNNVNFIKKLLHILNLPENYEWVVRSGSGNGFHILFYASDNEIDFSESLKAAYGSNSIYKNVFKKIEFRWRKHLVLPPSKHPSGNHYEFLFSFPLYHPLSIDFMDLLIIINLYCKNIRKADNANIFLNYSEEEESEEEEEESEEEEEESEEEELILFFDTETTGLPKNWKASVNEIDNWPRLVQIAYILSNSRGKIIEKGNYIIKPNGFRIPAESTSVHRISNEKAQAEGLPVIQVLDKFKSLLKKADCLVAHNISFDEMIVGAELIRAGYTNYLTNKFKICTMKESTNYCKIPGNYGYKWPSLSELYYKLFQTNFEESHNAEYDIKATFECFWKLKQLGKL